MAIQLVLKAGTTQDQIAADKKVASTKRSVVACSLKSEGAKVETYAIVDAMYGQKRYVFKVTIGTQEAFISYSIMPDSLPSILGKTGWKNGVANKKQTDKYLKARGEELVTPPKGARKGSVYRPCEFKHIVEFLKCSAMQKSVFTVK